MLSKENNKNNCTKCSKENFSIKIINTDEGPVIIYGYVDTDAAKLSYKAYHNRAFDL